MAYNQLDPGDRGGGNPYSNAFTDPRRAFEQMAQDTPSRRAGGGGGSGGGVPSWMTTSQPAPIGSQGVSGLLPSSGIPGMASAIPGTIGSHGASSVPFAADLMRTLSPWLDPRTIAALAAAGGSALSSLQPPAGQAQLEDLFTLAMERSRAAGPLFDQLLTQTQAQMPAYTRGA